MYAKTGLLIPFCFLFLFSMDGGFSGETGQIVEVRRCTGIGIVSGLANTGDSHTPAVGMVRKHIAGKLDAAVDGKIGEGSVAVVMISIDVPVQARTGDRFWASVNALGDATSLEGGELLLSAVFDPDGGFVLHVFGDVVVDKSSIRNGAVMAGEQSGAVVAMTDASGWTRKRPILVETGEMVVVTASGRGWTIYASGTALGAGARDQLILVEDLSTRKQYRCRVTGVGEVEMLRSFLRRKAADSRRSEEHTVMSEKHF